MQTSDALEVFQERVEPRITETDRGCWITDLSDNGNGYVYIRVRPQRFAIHRLAYEAFVGEIPDGFLVMHSCDNRGCCNPDHLSAGTQAENIADMDSKGRRGTWSPAGESNPAATLTRDQVREILRDDDTPQRELADRYGVSESLVSAIKRGVAWGHIQASED